MLGFLKLYLFIIVLSCLGFGYIWFKLFIPCLVLLEEMCVSVRHSSSCFQKSSWKRSSLLPSALGLGELWLIRTTLLFICLTCGNICNLFLVRESSARTWLDFQTHVANENQPPESRGQWGTGKGVLSSHHPLLQTPTPVRSEVETILLELRDRDPVPTWKRLWCVVSNESWRLPTATRHYHSDHERKWNGSSR